MVKVKSVVKPKAKLRQEQSMASCKKVMQVVQKFVLATKLK